MTVSERHVPSRASSQHGDGVGELASSRRLHGPGLGDVQIMAVQIMAVPNAASARTPLSLCRSDGTIRAAVHIEYARAGVFGLTWQHGRWKTRWLESARELRSNPPNTCRYFSPPRMRTQRVTPDQ